MKDSMKRFLLCILLVVASVIFGYLLRMSVEGLISAHDYNKANAQTPDALIAELNRTAGKGGEG